MTKRQTMKTPSRVRKRWRADVVSRRAAALCLLSALAIWPLRSKAGPEPLLVIVHPENPAASLDRNDLNTIFLTKKRVWPSGDPIEPFNLPSESPLRQDFDRAAHGFDPEEIARYWIDRKIRGGAAPPPQLSNPATVAAVVAARRNAVGYVGASTPHPSVKVVARIVDGNVVAP